MRVRVLRMRMGVLRLESDGSERGSVVSQWDITRQEVTYQGERTLAGSTLDMGINW